MLSREWSMSPANITHHRPLHPLSLLLLLLLLPLLYAEDIRVILTEEDTMPDISWRLELDSPLHKFEAFTICARFYTHQFRSFRTLNRIIIY